MIIVRGKHSDLPTLGDSLLFRMLGPWGTQDGGGKFRIDWVQYMITIGNCMLETIWNFAVVCDGLICFFPFEIHLSKTRIVNEVQVLEYYQGSV